MTTAERTYKTGDAKCRFGATLTADEIDLLGAEVRFVMTLKDNSKVIEGPAVNDTGTHVYYEFTADDLDTPGSYRAEWEVTFPSGAVQTFPDDGYHSIKILEDLD